MKLTTENGSVRNRIAPAIALFWAVWSSSLFAASSGYVIITTTNIVAQSTELTNFVTLRTTHGFDVQVISNTPTVQGGWGGGTGDTAAANIRSWLQQHYTNQSSEIVIDYVLLIGNPDPSTGDVPMKKCYPANTTTMEPSDLYYAELTADWDANTNGFCGEWADSTNSCLEFRTYEVSVGRIPFYGNINTLDAILQKIRVYEEEVRLEVGWRPKALLAMNQEDIYITTRYQGEWIKDNAVIPKEWSYHRVYDDGSPETSPCTVSNVTSVWTNDDFGVVSWFSHGSPTVAVDVMDLDHAASLDDAHPAFVFQGSCLNAHPETTNNLAFTLLSKGSLSTVAATREASYLMFIMPDYQRDFAPGFHIWYVRRLVRDELPAADALLQHKYENPPRNATAWCNYIIFNLYGCPAGSPYAVRFHGPVWSF